MITTVNDQLEIKVGTTTYKFRVKGASQIARNSAHLKNS